MALVGGVQPGVMQHLCRHRPGLGLQRQQVPDQVLGGRRNRGPRRAIELEPRALHIRQYLPIRAAPERRPTREQAVEKRAAAPDVASVTIASAQHFGRHIEYRSNIGLHGHTRLEALGEPKINHLERCAVDGLLGLEEEVLRLDVAVADKDRVQVPYRGEHLPHDDRRVALREVPDLDDAIKELPSFAQFLHEVDALLGLEAVVQADEVGMVHRSGKLNLTDESLEVFDVLFHDGLDRADGSGGSRIGLRSCLRVGLADHAEGALADGPRLEHVVVLQLSLRGRSKQSIPKPRRTAHPRDALRRAPLGAPHGRCRLRGLAVAGGGAGGAPGLGAPRAAGRIDDGGLRSAGEQLLDILGGLPVVKPHRVLGRHVSRPLPVALHGLPAQATARLEDHGLELGAAGNMPRHRRLASPDRKGIAGRAESQSTARFPVPQGLASAH
mmetsp:Transcript_71523/g.185927  ORF Transcript_71523/g.185927 Transcript_71523/m.185927 type:complete len:441 (-) Transcript_71523:156-1478(-)